MRRLLRSNDRLIASALLGAFVLVLSVTCVAQAGTEAQMACCAAMIDGCGGSTAHHDCCPTEQQGQGPQLTASQRVSAPSPDLSAFVFLHLQPATLSAMSLASVLDRPDTSPPSARGLSPQLLLSIFRV
jgi:hypothetical protein